MLSLTSSRPPASSTCSKISSSFSAPPAAETAAFKCSSFSADGISEPFLEEACFLPRGESFFALLAAVGLVGFAVGFVVGVAFAEAAGFADDEAASLVDSVTALALAVSFFAVSVVSGVAFSELAFSGVAFSEVASGFSSDLASDFSDCLSACCFAIDACLSWERIVVVVVDDANGPFKLTKFVLDSPFG